MVLAEHREQVGLVRRQPLCEEHDGWAEIAEDGWRVGNGRNGSRNKILLVGELPADLVTDLAMDSDHVGGPGRLGCEAVEAGRADL